MFMIEIIYGVILALFHYFNEVIDKKVHKYKTEVMSLSAGVAVAYIFLVLFKELFEVEMFTPYLLIVVLFGFSLLHVVEKHVYQHKSRKRKLRELKEIHSISFFIYHFFLGIVLYYFVQESFRSGLFFFIPIFLHSVLSGISLSEIDSKVRESGIVKLLLSLAPIFGIVLAMVVTIPVWVYSCILAFVLGVLIYVVIRDQIPYKEEGNSLYFLVGVFLMLLLLLLLLS